LDNIDKEPQAAQSAVLFRAALVDSVSVLVQEHGVERVLLMGGVTKAWAADFSEHRIFDALAARSGCGVGWICHPHPALLGAARIARSLI